MADPEHAVEVAMAELPPTDDVPAEPLEELVEDEPVPDDDRLVIDPDEADGRG